MGPAPRIPSVPSAPLLPPDDDSLINTNFGENVIGNPEKVIENIENALNEVLGLPEIELWDPLINVLSTKADEVLQDDYINDNVLNKKTIEGIKDGCNFDQIKDIFDMGKAWIFLWQRQWKFFKFM